MGDKLVSFHCTYQLAKHSIIPLSARSLSTSGQVFYALSCSASQSAKIIPSPRPGQCRIIHKARVRCRTGHQGPMVLSEEAPSSRIPQDLSKDNKFKKRTKKFLIQNHKKDMCTVFDEFAVTFLVFG